MVSVKIYVEGGGRQNSNLETLCRNAFRKFFTEAGVSSRQFTIVACGPRSEAYKKFKIACKSSDVVILLVDSEELVDSAHWDTPWDHLAGCPKDKWSRPAQANDDQCHLMVTCMESWFLADKAALSAFFERDFKAQALPSNPDIEKIPKSSVEAGLKNASKGCQCGCYSKGDHSFKILAQIDPAKVAQASPWAKRLIEHLKKQKP